MKRLLAAGLAVLVVLVPAQPAAADEPKNRNFDVIRDEAKVPAYQLPPLLISIEGNPITTPEDWFSLHSVDPEGAIQGRSRRANHERN